MEAYINEFKDLIDLSSYTGPIVIILKFCRGLNSTTQVISLSLAQIDRGTWTSMAGLRQYDA
jgi:hypothetical protein